jgi:hypothetical protein
MSLDFASGPERKKAVPSPPGTPGVGLAATQALITQLQRSGGNQATGKLLAALRERPLPSPGASQAAVQRFRVNAALSTAQARTNATAKQTVEGLTEPVTALDDALKALATFEAEKLPGALESAGDATVLQERLAPAVELVESVRTAADRTRRAVISLPAYRQEIETAGSQVQDVKGNQPWFAYGKQLDAIADAADADLEGLRTGRYVSTDYQDRVARGDVKLTALAGAVHRAQEGKLGLLDRIASYVLAIMHTHDHVEYSLDQDALRAEGTGAEGGDLAGAWQTYRDRTSEVAYYKELRQLLQSGGNAKDRAAAERVRDALQPVGAQFDPDSERTSTSTSAEALGGVHGRFTGAATYGEKFAILYEYLPSIRSKEAKRINGQKAIDAFRAAAPYADATYSQMEKDAGTSLRHLQAVRLAANATPGADASAAQEERLSVTVGDKPEGHSDIQARNVAVALRDNQLLIAYNYTVKRAIGREDLTLESQPAPDLVQHTLDALAAEIGAEKSRADADPKLKAIQSVSFVNVEGGEGWSGFHAEMKLLSHLKALAGGEIAPGSVAFGVGKAVCRRCTAQLDALQLAHRDVHFKRVSNWTMPQARQGTVAATRSLNEKT